VGDERELLERARAFDVEALGQVYDSYHLRIYRYIYARVGNSSLAEDLTAEVFTQMLEAIRSERTWRESLSGWLYRIAHNLVVDYYRRRPREGLPLNEGLVASQETPGVVVEGKLQEASLREAIASLTEEQQQVVTLKFIEGLTNSEVAQLLGKSEGAVKALQYRALVSLARVMGQGG
jgi:RNA polymerase sigma-70 factor (ECF subfamily)